MLEIGAWLDEVRAHAREAYPEECCGLVTRDPAAGLSAHRGRNVQDELHARDPRAHPRTARTGFTLAAADWIRVGRAAASAGGAIVAVYHSHPDGGAAASEHDRRGFAAGTDPHPAGAAGGGPGPLARALVHVVVAVTRAGEVRMAQYGPTLPPQLATPRTR